MLALIGIGMLYLLFPSAAFTGDGTLFADLARNFGSDGSTEYYRLLLHPHHLLYGPLAAWFVDAMGPPPAGVGDYEILRLAHLSSLLATAALVVFLLAVWRATRDIVASMLMTLLLAFSGGFWGFAVNVEVQPLMLLALVLFLAALALPPGRRGAVWLGLAHGFAMLAHGLNGLLVLPAILHLWGRKDERPGRWRRIILYGAVAGALPMLAYGIAIPWVGGPSVATLRAWLPPRYGLGYLSAPWAGTGPALAGLETVFLARPHLVAGQATSFWWALRLLIPAVVIGIFFLRRDADRSEGAGRLARGAAWTLLAYAPLWLLWDAGNPEFLVLAAPPTVALLAVMVSRRARGRGRRRALLLLGLAILASLLGSYHFAAVIYPQADPWNNTPWVWTQFIRAHTRPDELVVLSGVGDYQIGKFYLRYFGPRRRVSVQWEFLEYGDRERVITDLQRTLAQEAAAGRRPILTSEMFDPDTSKKLEAEFGFDRAAKVRVLQGWNLRAIATMPDGFTIYAMLPDVGKIASP